MKLWQFFLIYGTVIALIVFVGVVKFMAWWQVAMHGCN